MIIIVNKNDRNNLLLLLTPLEMFDIINMIEVKRDYYGKPFNSKVRYLLRTKRSPLATYF